MLPEVCWKTVLFKRIMWKIAPKEKVSILELIDIGLPEGCFRISGATYPTVPQVSKICYF